MALNQARAGMGASARYALSSSAEYGSAFMGGSSIDARRELPSKAGPVRDTFEPPDRTPARPWFVPLVIVAGLYFLTR